MYSTVGNSFFTAINVSLKKEKKRNIVIYPVIIQQWFDPFRAAVHRNVQLHIQKRQKRQ